MVGTLVFSTLALVASVVPPRGRWVSLVARSWGRGVLASGFVRLTVERSSLPEGSLVYVANHQSLFDIAALLVALPGQVRFLAKASLFRIPVFGWAMRAGGFVPVDRGRSDRGRKSFTQALTRLERGVSVVVFPEERRSLDGRVRPFRRGGMLMALKTGLPIVPVGIDGTLGVQSRRSFVIRPSRVHVRIGEARDLSGVSVRDLGARAEELRNEVARLAHAELADDWSDDAPIGKQPEERVV